MLSLRGLPFSIENPPDPSGRKGSKILDPEYSGLHSSPLPRSHLFCPSSPAKERFIVEKNNYHFAYSMDSKSGKKSLKTITPKRTLHINPKSLVSFDLKRIHLELLFLLFVLTHLQKLHYPINS